MDESRTFKELVKESLKILKIPTENIASDKTMCDDTAEVIKNHVLEYSSKATTTIKRKYKDGEKMIFLVALTCAYRKMHLISKLRGESKKDFPKETWKNLGRIYEDIIENADLDITLKTKYPKYLCSQIINFGNVEGYKNEKKKFEGMLNKLKEEYVGELITDINELINLINLNKQYCIFDKLCVLSTIDTSIIVQNQIVNFIYETTKNIEIDLLSTIPIDEINDTLIEKIIGYNLSNFKFDDIEYKKADLFFNKMQNIINSMKKCLWKYIKLNYVDNESDLNYVIFVEDI